MILCTEYSSQRYTHQRLHYSPFNAAHTVLASQLGGWVAWTGSCSLLYASLDASPNLAMSPAICWMCSIGSPLQQRIIALFW